MDFLKTIESKIFSRQDLVKKTNTWKNSGSTIVFTNGCFDILHYGHVNYLAKARSLGDKLIIGLNSDASVKRLKGKDRPINDQVARANILASLLVVDAVVVFDEDTPKDIIELLSPNVLVKGGDYCFEDIVGADFIVKNGGKVEVIPTVDGFSSSNIINKL